MRVLRWVFSLLYSLSFIIVSNSASLECHESEEPMAEIWNGRSVMEFCLLPGVCGSSSVLPSASALFCLVCVPSLNLRAHILYSKTWNNLWWNREWKLSLSWWMGAGYSWRKRWKVHRKEALSYRFERLTVSRGSIFWWSEGIVEGESPVSQQWECE